MGSLFALEALDRDDHVAIIDSGKDARHGWTLQRLNAERVHMFHVALERMPEDELAKLLGSVDAVVHAAAYTGIPSSATDPVGDWVANVESTRHLLETMRRNKIQVPTVVLSSVKPYELSGLPLYASSIVGVNGGEKVRSVMLTVEHGERGGLGHLFGGVSEQFPLEPDEPYAASKMAQSGLALAYARSYGLPITVFRCSNLYGPGPCHGPRHGWLTWFCICAALNWPLVLQGSGVQSRDMLYSGDLNRAINFALQRIDEVQGELFNVGGGVSSIISVRDAINLLVKSPGTVKESPGRAHEDLLFVTNIEKFFRATGWYPEVSVETGVASITSWATKNAEALRRVYAEFAPQ